MTVANYKRTNLGIRSRGFSLMEMAIVLVVIGLILAAVSVGKDAQRNASYQKVMQTFIKPWAAAYGEYYSRNGVVLGDTTPPATGQVNRGTAELDGNNLRTMLTNVGIGLPGGNGAGQEDQYVYTDHAGITRKLTVSFVHSSVAEVPNFGCAVRNKCNLLRLQNVTPALAKTLDVAVDGIADRVNGVFRCAQNAFADVADETAATFGDCFWEMDY